MSPLTFSNTPLHVLLSITLHLYVLGVLLDRSATADLNMTEKSATSACVPITNTITERDTVAEEDRASYDEFHHHILSQPDVYSGFFYDENYVWFKVHNADTHEITVEKKFKGSGKAMDYLLLQVPDVTPEHLTLAGPVRKPTSSKVRSDLGDGK